MKHTKNHIQYLESFVNAALISSAARFLSWSGRILFGRVGNTVHYSPPIPLPFWPQAQSLRYCITQWDLTGKLEGGRVTIEERNNRQLSRSGFCPLPSLDCASCGCSSYSTIIQNQTFSLVCYVGYLVLAHFKWKSGLVRIADIICSTIKMTRHFIIWQIDLYLDMDSIYQGRFKKGATHTFSHEGVYVQMLLPKQKVFSIPHRIILQQHALQITHPTETVLQ